MSNDKRKRGLARTQQTAASIGGSTEAWDKARSAYEAAERAHDDACEAARAAGRSDVPQDTLKAFEAARDALLGTQAPNGAALAVKIAAHRTMSGGGAISAPEQWHWIAEHGDDEDKGALAIYFDALALAGVTASVPAPSLARKPWVEIAREHEAARVAFDQYEGEEEAPDDVKARYLAAKAALIETPAADLHGIAIKVGRFAMGLEGIDVHNPAELQEARGSDGIGRLIVDLYDRLQTMGARQDTASDADWLMVCLHSEAVAKRCADEEWAQYALNPQGLCSLVETLASFQEDIRDLAHFACPGAMSVAIDAVYFGRNPYNDTPPRGPGGGLPLPSSGDARAEWDSAVAGYKAAMAVAAGDEAATALEAVDRALDRLLALSPPDLDGVRVLFEAVVLHTQALGEGDNAAAVGAEPLTADRLCDSVGWSDVPHVILQTGKGLKAGLALVDRALRRLSGETADRDATMFLAWEAEANRLYAEYEAAEDGDDEVAANRLYEAAGQVHVRILTTPAAGQTVAAVKLRALLHPTVGLVASSQLRADEPDARGLTTALAALTGSHGFDAGAWLADYQADGGKVRRVLVEGMGRGLMFAHPDTPEGAAAHDRLNSAIPGGVGMAALFYAARVEVMPGGAARSVPDLTSQEQAAGRVVAAVVFPELIRRVDREAL